VSRAATPVAPDEHGGVAAAGAVVIGVVALALAAFVATMFLAMSAAAGGSSNKNSSPSAKAVADIPHELLPVYQQAAHDTCGMPWGVLAAIGKVESDHGRSDLPGVHSGSNYAGAEGPMQFEPETWAAYGVDGNHDGTTDVYDPVDAIWGAANYLCANGAGDPARLRDAVFAYNRDWGYVSDVLAQADAYATAPAGDVPSGDASSVLNNPNITLCAACRQDLIDGVIDQRVIDFLVWAAQHYALSISVLKTGHSQFVAGTDRISNHWEGRAADIASVDGQDVTASCDVCRSFAEVIVSLGAGRPDEMGVPWGDMVGAGGWDVFSDADHQDHIHVGWNVNPRSPAEA
jgi:hypothetical protein